MPKFPKQRSSHGREQREPVEEQVEQRLPPINPSSIKLKAITPKNARQQAVLESVTENDLTFVLGPAGTGKTFLLAYAALRCLVEEEVDRIIISRPAVEAGNSLGYLPGTINEKMDPYVAPLIAAFKQLVGPNIFQRLFDHQLIQILPFGYMRGHSISNSFIFLDEGQNASADEMKTALTRIGEGSVCVVTADPDQIDLPIKTASSVNDMERFRDVKGIGFVEFLPQDVIRSKIVRTVLECYAEPA